ncbi:thiamine pyrophosphate-binding protein [Aliikangiella coralliicola]|uniref:Rieske 2Fe-2S domain-containing protein n=1 Tax=Aliikangiella coralliicola TaxID=2592383 RepID=A0A545U933_9GAMM|nr:thiamine pyrophosphate-binding protein [Aliikangiella coralliicola]TQV85978.1 Rieske 2Fe-2S domain-containing protein [Aliikangiella coralliicola]
MTGKKQPDLDWHKVAELDDLPEGRCKTVTAGTKSFALTHIQGQYTAMDNRCPHQGGPLGEGSIEQGANGECWLRCPWHGWDFDPITGKPPGGHEDSGQEIFPLEVRENGVYIGLKKEVTKPRTISDVMAETMTNWGVKSVFGMVGHSNLGLADALRNQEVKGNLSFFGVRHEGAAAFACSGYAKASGKPAACLTIAGPGATNLLTGLWDAKVDRAPVLALTGQIDAQVLGPGAFQEIDLSSAFESVADFSQTVLDSSKHGELMNLACKNAIVNRTPAHLIFPDDVQTIGARENASVGGPKGRLGDTAITPSKDSISQVLEMLKKHKRPIIIVGYGAKYSMDQVVHLAEKLKAPVLTTFKAKGQLPDSHPLAAGVLGRSGTPVASWFMNECDLILVFGASFSNHTGITNKRPIIQVDFDQMALGKFHPVTLPVWGEISTTASLIEQQLKINIGTVDQRKELAERWQIWREEKTSRMKDDSGKGINSASIFDSLSRLVPGNAIIAVDVGNNTYSFGRYFECANQNVLMSGYLGSIGFSFPAAMGAWAATQDLQELKARPIVSVSGDGGFGQYLADFTTAVKYKMNITHILLNNGQLGKITKEQRAAEWAVWQTSLHNPSFSSYAKLCGAHGEKVTDKNKLDDAVIKALNYDGPALVEIISDANLI